MWNKQTKRNLAVLLTAAAVLASGLALTAWAKKPDNPGGGKPGGDPPPARFAQVDLGDTVGPTGINDAGQVVGGVSVGAGPHAILLTPEDTDGDSLPDTWFRDDNGDGINDLILDLGVLGVMELIDENGTVIRTEESSWGSAINDMGQVVGASTFDVQTTVSVHHAALWDAGNMIDLGSLWLGGISEACSINNLGQVVGYTYGPGVKTEAFVISPETDASGNPVWFRDDDGDGFNDLMIGLGTFGGLESRAYFINDYGQIVGYAETTAAHRAFLITPEYDIDGNPVVWFRDDDSDGINDLMTDLGTLGGSSSWGYAMNDLGQIAGTGQINSSTSRAFLITPEYDGFGNPVVWFRDSDGDGANDLMTDLGTLKSLTGSRPADLNNDAQVVGNSYKGSPHHTHFVRKPFFWENGQMKDLNELTDSDIDIGGWIEGINNAGQIISRSGFILLPIPADP